MSNSARCRFKRLAVSFVALGMSTAVMAMSGHQAFAADLEAEANKAQVPAGILPIPEYGGDLASRAYLSGDWGGSRTELANQGFQFNVDALLWTDTALDGGTSDDTEFGGNFTYNATWDLMRAGIIPGAIVQVRAESRVGSSGNLNTGQFVPVNTAALSPTNYSDIDAGYDIALSQLSYLQFLSPQVAVIFGKLDMYGDGDLNEFAGGRGRTQFMNWSLNYGTPLLFIPASTLGAGVTYLPNHNVTITSLVLSGTDCTNGDCFDNLDKKGGISVTQGSYQYNINGLPGGVSGMYAYFFGGDFTDIRSVAPVPGEGLVGSTKDSSWIVSGSFWQYLQVDQPHEGPVSLTNREPDLQGWGIFARLSVADDRTNPWNVSVAAGVGGRGIIPDRPDDLFGVGYFYNDLSRGLILEPFDDGQGVEAFYNFSLTPALKLSANMQYTFSTRPLVEDTFLLSTRLQATF